MIFNLGAGSFDVSLMSFKDNVLTTIATSGDTHFGGEDFTIRLTEHLIEKF